MENVKPDASQYIEHADGTKEWFQDDKLHRTDGPAIVHADGRKLWYLFGNGYEDLKVFVAASEILVALFPELRSDN